MDGLIHVAPECRVCGAHPTQTFTRDELPELLKQQVLELHCTHFDKRSLAAGEQREGLLRAVGGSDRRSEETAAAT